MLPLLLAGAIWGYNAVKIAQLANRKNRIRKRDPEDGETKNLTIYKDCTFRYEDKRTYNNYNNCTFNTYYIIREEKDERPRGYPKGCFERHKDQED
jgi:hypothetical protein